MDQNAIFGVQFLLSLIVYALIAKWYVTPWLTEKPVKQALIPLIFPHAFRHMGQDQRSLCAAIFALLAAVVGVAYWLGAKFG